ncbi:uncharacterized protein LOC120690177 isoform X6 [Panicum virgatum]|uniref:uncharacterized protein LOC120690177 isoform X6 n=1 Tax=Panicum virgatum TaxID=38727 RepID=UPI0019D5E92F|nr:uncharacterized protein LOC120690177 isoform X6 [Panicum virgatum]
MLTLRIPEIQLQPPSSLKDHERFRAKCVRADKGCNWIFFASTSKKIYIGCKVKKNGPTHNCGSVNNCGDTMATNNWVAERVVDWLKEDPKKGPKELQAALKKRCPDAIAYLDENHPYLWSRSKFSDHCKVDYINNNLSESFNNWVKVKDLQIVEMHDNIRRMIIAKFELRSKIAESIEGKIIPSITKALTTQSKAIKDCEVLRCGHGTTEVNAPTKSGVLFRYAVNLELKTCSCRAWQVSGKPCRHALAFIAKLSRDPHG